MRCLLLCIPYTSFLRLLRPLHSQQGAWATSRPFSQTVSISNFIFYLRCQRCFRYIHPSTHLSSWPYNSLSHCSTTISHAWRTSWCILNCIYRFFFILISHLRLNRRRAWMSVVNLVSSTSRAFLAGLFTIVRNDAHPDTILDKILFEERPASGWSFVGDDLVPGGVTRVAVVCDFLAIPIPDIFLFAPPLEAPFPRLTGVLVLQPFRLGMFWVDARVRDAAIFLTLVWIASRTAFWEALLTRSSSFPRCSFQSLLLGSLFHVRLHTWTSEIGNPDFLLKQSQWARSAP